MIFEVGDKFGVELGFSVFWVEGHFNLSDYFAVVVVARTKLHSLLYQLNFGLLESSAGHFRAYHDPLMACGLPHEKLRYRVSINYMYTVHSHTPPLFVSEGCKKSEFVANFRRLPFTLPCICVNIYLSFVH